MAEATEALLAFSRVRTACTGCEDGVGHIWKLLKLEAPRPSQRLSRWASLSRRAVSCARYECRWLDRLL